MELDTKSAAKTQTIQLLCARFGSLDSAFQSFKNRDGFVTKMNLLKGVKTFLGLAPSYGYELLELFSGEGPIHLEEWMSRLSQCLIPAQESIPGKDTGEIPEVSQEPTSPKSPDTLSDISLATVIDLDSDVDSLCSLPLREEDVRISFTPRSKPIKDLPVLSHSLSVLEALARTTTQLRRSRQDLRRRLIGARFHQLRLY